MHRVARLAVAESHSLASRCFLFLKAQVHRIWNEHLNLQCRDPIAVVGTHSRVEVEKVAVHSLGVLAVTEVDADEETCRTLFEVVNDEVAGWVELH